MTYADPTLPSVMPPFCARISGLSASMNRQVSAGHPARLGLRLSAFAYDFKVACGLCELCLFDFTTTHPSHGLGVMYAHGQLYQRTTPSATLATTASSPCVFDGPSGISSQ